jgi:hypothetical protein
MYTSSDKVGALTGLTFSSTSRPTEDQVTAFVAQVDAEVRGTLEQAGYDPDTTDATALSLLEQYATLGAADPVMLATKRLEDADAYRRRYQAWLALVRTRQAAGLVAPSTVSALPASRYTYRPSGHPDHVFKRGEVQW